MIIWTCAAYQPAQGPGKLFIVFTGEAFVMASFYLGTFFLLPSYEEIPAGDVKYWAEINAPPTTGGAA